MIRIIIAAPFIALAIYMIVEKQWLFLWIRNFQLTLMDSYYFMLTSMITVIITCLPVLPLIGVARKYYEKKKGD